MSAKTESRDRKQKEAAAGFVVAEECGNVEALCQTFFETGSSHIQPAWESEGGEERRGKKPTPQPEPMRGGGKKKERERGEKKERKKKQKGSKLLLRLLLPGCREAAAGSGAAAAPWGEDGEGSGGWGSRWQRFLFLAFIFFPPREGGEGL